MSPQSPNFAHIDSDGLISLLKSDDPPLVLDVREPHEYRLRHIPQAVLMPLNSLTVETVRGLDHAAKLIVLCEHGIRSQYAAAFLCSLGFEEVVNLSGGMADFTGETTNKSGD